MEIIITYAGVTSIATQHRDQEMVWPTTALWTKLGTTTTESVYGPLNEYWASLPLSLQDQYFALYRDAYDLVEEESNVDVIHKGLTALAARLYELLDYEHMRQWVLTYGRIAYNDDILDHYTGDYPKRQTYLKAEYNELVVLSMYFKMLTPLWCKYVSATPNMDKLDRELVNYALLDQSRVHEQPAMERLKDYCAALAEKESDKLTPTICTYMGTSEIPRYFLAMVVVRRISIGEIRDPNKTLIKVAYKFLESKAKNLSNGVRDKFRKGQVDADEPESVVERYRISQTVADYAIEVMEAYVENTQAIVLALNPEGNVAKAESYISVMLNNPRFTIAAYHLPLMGLVVRRAVYPRSCRYVSRDTFVRLIGVAAAWYSDKGYQSLANVLIAARTEKDVDAGDLHSVGGYSFAPLRKDLKEQLEGIYPFIQHDLQGRPLINPGIQMIDEIIAEINLYEWADRGLVPLTLRNDVAELIIKLEHDAV